MFAAALLCVRSALAATGGWWLEAPPAATQEDAAGVEAAALKDGYHARVVKRFTLGRGWAFVALVEGFPDDAAATAAGAKLASQTGVTLTVVHDPERGPTTRKSVVKTTGAPAVPMSAGALVDAAVAAHGGPEGGAAALARAAAVHFAFDREFEVDGKGVRISHDYWRDATSRSVKVSTHGAGTDSVSVASAAGAWIKVGGAVQTRDIGVMIAQADAFAPEAILGVALDVPNLFATSESDHLSLLEGAESGDRVGRGEDPSEPGLAFADVDPVTGHLVRVRYVTEGGPVLFEMSGWRESAPGVFAPDTLTLERADGRRETIRVKRLEVASSAPAGTFAAPANDAAAP